jgi:hypothetical protein
MNEYAVTIPAVVGCSRCPDGRVLLRVHVLPNGAPTMLYLSAIQAEQLARDLKDAADPK